MSLYKIDKNQKVGFVLSIKKVPEEERKMVEAFLKLQPTTKKELIQKCA
ncbi:hypothetical protein K8R61_00155 [bacterium]|nr:hypothetical protein [bacterium]